MVVMTNTPRHLVRQKKLKRTFEHLARHFVASLSLVLGRLNGLWPYLVPLVTRQTMKVTRVGTRFPKTNYLPVRSLITLENRTAFTRIITARTSSLIDNLQSTTRVLSCTVLTSENPPPEF